MHRLDRSYAGLRAEFAAREPGEATLTWYDPDQTVGFWIRRMALETVVHRIDAELAAGTPVTPVPDDLAADGVDEILTVMLAYETTASAAASVAGAPRDVLLWLWGRQDGAGLTFGGDGAPVERLRWLLKESTQ
ncbi:maleylpyruvate isomerase N-terminal domain-containing protein [Nonomuraea bangladeshensis]|uniref:Maleylpyruvate isomerase N-terminal domain-containing protein n=1 Tax=Nonomuraea bangladeshensis TaxID=404385 RepID=A0ABV3H2I0_9ACTN